MPAHSSGEDDNVPDPIHEVIMDVFMASNSLYYLPPNTLGNPMKSAED